MLLCDQFKFVVLVSDGPESLLKFRVVSDLPCGTEVGISCHRTYLDRAGALTLWLGHGQRHTLAKLADGTQGCTGAVNVDETDRQAAAWFQRSNSGATPAGISTPVSLLFTITATVGAPQSLSEFGEANANLDGRRVTNHAGIRIVQVSRDFSLPLAKILQPAVQPAIGLNAAN